MYPEIVSFLADTLRGTGAPQNEAFVPLTQNTLLGM